MNRAMLTALFFLCACAQSTTPPSGSQTHFLERCDDSCPAPYECVADVCTRACEPEGHDVCSELAEGAHCIPWTLTTGEGIPFSGDICDVECMRDADCRALSDAHSCESNRCRAPSMDDTRGDGGAGGDGGASGQGGSGGGSGSGGTSGTSGTGGVGGNVMDASVYDPICNGTTAIRFGVTSAGGFVAPTYDFTSPYGHWFLFIDGLCNFYISTGYMDGIRSGRLSDDERDAITDELGWHSIERWSENNVDPGCPDGAPTALRRAGATTTCTCVCSPDFHPQDKIDAFAAIDAWLMRLSAASEASAGDVQALAVRAEDVVPFEPLSWPLDRPMADFDFIAATDADIASTSPTVFTGDDARALQALRDDALAQEATIAFIPVMDEELRYRLYVRDELAPSLTADIDAFLEAP